MSGEPSQTESIALILESIKKSNDNLISVIMAHNALVLETINTLICKKNLDKTFVKVKDPLVELKKVHQDFKSLDKLNLLTTIVNILSLYEEEKISLVFKQLFQEIFEYCITGNCKDFLYQLNDIKTKILKVRDIKWILSTMEQYPHLFKFTENDLAIMSEYNASRDNVFLVKKILKKDGVFQEFFHDPDSRLTDQRVRSKYTMKNGTLIGLYEEWFENGNKSLECTENGINKGWYPNGKIRNQYTMKDSKIHGIYKEWYDNGHLWCEATYNNGRMCGKYTHYFNDGKPFRQMNCVDGVLNGSDSVFYIQGEYKEWFPNGNLAIDLYCLEGKVQNCVFNIRMDGLFKEWNIDGSPKYIINYKDGLYHGEYKEWVNGQEKTRMYTKGIHEMKDIHPITCIVLFNDCINPAFEKLARDFPTINFGFCTSKTYESGIFICHKGKPIIKYEGKDLEQFANDFLKFIESNK